MQVFSAVLIVVILMTLHRAHSQTHRICTGGEIKDAWQRVCGAAKRGQIDLRQWSPFRSSEPNPLYTYPIMYGDGIREYDRNPLYRSKTIPGNARYRAYVPRYYRHTDIYGMKPETAQNWFPFSWTDDNPQRPKRETFDEIFNQCCENGCTDELLRSKGLCETPFP